MQKSLFIGVRAGILIKHFINFLFKIFYYYPNGMVYALFGSLASSKIIPLVAPGILSTFFSIDSYHALKLSLNHREQTEFAL